MAFTVPMTRGSSAGRNPTSGIMQEAGVQVFASVILHKRIHIRIETLPANLLVDRLSKFFPPRNINLEPAFFRRPVSAGRPPPTPSSSSARNAAADRAPPKSPRPAAPIQSPEIPAWPALSRCANARRSQSRFAGLKKRVRHLTKNIQLILLVSRIARSHRRRFLISRQPWQLQFREPAFAVKAVNNVEFRGAAGNGSQQPFPPLSRLFQISGIQQSLQSQSRIPHPAKTVIPVAHAAQQFGQRSCRRRHDAARGQEMSDPFSVISERRTASRHFP